MTDQQAAAGRFRYDGYTIDPARGVTCRYSVGDRFTERFTFGPAGTGTLPPPTPPPACSTCWPASPTTRRRPPRGSTWAPATTAEERAFLRSFYVDGLGEFAYRNGLDLRASLRRARDRDTRAGPAPPGGRPLVPFGGGIDSIVTVEASGAVTGRRAVRGDQAERTVRGHRTPGRGHRAAGAPRRREIDPAVLRSTELGFLNGHVPVTGILSAMAVLAAGSSAATRW